MDTITQFGSSLFGPVWPLVWNVVKIVALLAPLMICVAYLTLWERKAIGWTQIRPGPNRVGPFGLLTPIADAVKLIFKEIILPTASNKRLFLLGPVMTIMPALGLVRVARCDVPVVELAAAAADLRRVLHLGAGRDEPRAVRRGRRRVGDRRRPHDRVLGHGLRDVLPRRVREHDPRVVPRGR